jgi:hypothetical protein
LKFTVTGFASAIWSLVKGVGGTQVSVSDLTVYKGPKGLPMNLKDFIRFGGKPLDGILWFTNGCPEGYKAMTCTAIEVQMDAAYEKAKKDLQKFVVYALLKGSYPSSSGTETSKDIPAFVVKQLGMTESPAALAAALASFPLAALPGAFLSQMRIEKMAGPIVNRCHKGIAGTRMMTVLTHIRPKASNVDMLKAVRWCYARLLEAQSWTTHPLTKPDKIIELGSVNAAIESLLPNIYPKDDLELLVKKGFLSEVPVTRDFDLILWQKITSVTWPVAPIFSDGKAILTTMPFADLFDGIKDEPIGTPTVV